MVVIVLERAKPSLRGALTRWLSEIKAGVYVGFVSARVRDLLWDRILRDLGPDAAATLIFPAPTEQGFAVRTAGRVSRTWRDFDGLFLTKRPLPPQNPVPSPPTRG